MKAIWGSYEVSMGCKGVETNVYQLVRECDERLDSCLLYTSRCV